MNNTASSVLHKLLIIFQTFTVIVDVMAILGTTTLSILPSIMGDADVNGWRLILIVLYGLLTVAVIDVGALFGIVKKRPWALVLLAYGVAISIAGVFVKLYTNEQEVSKVVIASLLPLTIAIAKAVAFHMVLRRQQLPSSTMKPGEYLTQIDHHHSSGVAHAIGLVTLVASIVPSIVITNQTGTTRSVTSKITFDRSDLSNYSPSEASAYVSFPTPALISAVAIDDRVSGIDYLDGGLVVTSDHKGWHYFDVSQPAHPVTKTIQGGTSGAGVAATANSFIISTSISSFMYTPVADGLQRRAKITEVGNVARGTGNTTYGIGQAGSSYNLLILDTGNPDNPQTISTTSLPKVNGAPEDVAVSGNVVAIAMGYNGVFLYDISNPATPKHVGTIERNNAVGVGFRSSVLWVSYSYPSALVSYDVSTIAQPKQLGILDDRVPSTGDALQIVGGAAIAGAWESGFVVYDIRDAVHPKLLRLFDTIQNLTDLVVFDHYAAAVVTGDSSAVLIFDLDRDEQIKSLLTASAGS